MCAYAAPDWLLLDGSPEGLRDKLTAGAGPLAAWWAHVLRLSRTDPVWYSPYTVLAALVTQTQEDRERARANFLRFVELKAAGDTSIDAQVHTHVTVAPLGRWAVWYDWLARERLFTSDEHAAIREAMVDHAWMFAQQHLQSRAKAFDNQMLSNAFCAAAVGAVFGFRHDSCARARRLYQNGLQWLHDLFACIPPAGYGLEGSTYQEHVVLPVMALSGMLYRDLTGQDVFHRGVSSSSVPLIDVLRFTWQTIGASGLLPGWDEYGFQVPTIKSGPALLARLANDARPLATVLDLEMWYRNDLPAWEHDDRLWTLVWWPEDLPLPELAEYPSWMAPEVAGALQHHATRTRVFQCWDECGGVPLSSRLQVDPNALTLEAFGTPLLLDGSGKLPVELQDYPTDTILDYAGNEPFASLQSYAKSAWGWELPIETAVSRGMSGAVGQSNALVLDGEGWYVPLSPCQGAGEALHEAGPLQALRSNAKAYYTDRYDVTRVQRSSLLVDGRYVFVTDRMESQTPHTVAWQAFCQRDVTPTDTGVRIDTVGGVRCDVLFHQSGDTTLADAPDYPKLSADGSVRVRHTVAPSADLRLDVTLLPLDRREVVADLTGGWREVTDPGRDISFDTFYLEDALGCEESPRVFVRTFTLDALPDGPLRLSFASTVADAALSVNGVELSSLYALHPHGHWRTGDSRPLLFDLTGALRDGENELRLTITPWHGETVCGPVRLVALHDAPAPTVEMCGDGQFCVFCAGKTDQVLMENERGAVAWAGGDTDARYAVLLHDGTLAVADATALSMPGDVRLQSQAPCDLAWMRSTLWLTRVEENTSLVWQRGGDCLRIEYGAVINITYQGTDGMTLSLAKAEGRHLLLNGEPIEGVADADGTVCLELAATVSADFPADVASTEDVYRLLATHADAAASLILDVLESGDWRTQLAAAEVAGRLRLQGAVEPLLRLFSEAEEELPYPALTHRWHWSKQLYHRDDIKGENADLPLPVAAKRWRLKRAVVTALGQIGDVRAVAPLQAAFARGDDFFTVTAQLPLALGRLGDASSVPLLEEHRDHAEVNTRRHVRLALDLLHGTIDRATFERYAATF